MKIIKDKSGYIIENSHEMKSNSDIADLLSLFLDKDSLLIFSIVDMEYFLNNLQNEDKKTQDFYNKLIAFNSSRGHKILRDDEEEHKKMSFIKERTVFINNESDILERYPRNKNRRIIWYKADSKEEIVKAINIDQFFKCIILQKGKDFYDYDYGIKQYETEEGKDLFIVEKQSGNFERYIYPKIYEKHILSNDLY